MGKVALLVTSVMLCGWLTGCAGMSPEERQAVGLLGGLASVSPNATPGEAALGGLVREEALRVDQQQHETAVAREGGTQVTVDVDGVAHQVEVYCHEGSFDSNVYDPRSGQNKLGEGWFAVMDSLSNAKEYFRGNGFGYIGVAKQKHPGGFVILNFPLKEADRARIVWKPSMRGLPRSEPAPPAKGTSMPEELQERCKIADRDGLCVTLLMDNDKSGGLSDGDWFQDEVTEFREGDIIWYFVKVPMRSTVKVFMVEQGELFVELKTFENDKALTAFQWYGVRVENAREAYRARPSGRHRVEVWVTRVVDRVPEGTPLVKKTIVINFGE